jgi:hypothetical protein
MLKPITEPCAQQIHFLTIYASCLCDSPHGPGAKHVEGFVMDGWADVRNINRPYLEGLEIVTSTLIQTCYISLVEGFPTAETLQTHHTSLVDFGTLWITKIV